MFVWCIFVQYSNGNEMISKPFTFTKVLTQEIRLHKDNDTKHKPINVGT